MPPKEHLPSLHAIAVAIPEISVSFKEAKTYRFIHDAIGVNEDPNYKRKTTKPTTVLNGEPFALFNVSNWI